MKISLHKKPRARGFVLLLVIILAGCSLLILAGVMSRTSTVSLLNLRSTQMNELDSAAEAAVEKAYARMAWDFNAYGPGYVTNEYAANAYQTLVPTASDNAYWGNFSFYNPVTGATNSVYVSYVTNYTGPLPMQFTNQYAYNSPIYRFACNATANNSLVNVVGCAQEDVLLALVPITTYAIFYNGELEFSDCATMVVNGRVHSNADICVGAGSGSTLTFNNLVTCVSSLSAPERMGVTIWTQNNPSTWLTTFNGGYTTNYQTINIAIQMTNTHSIIDIPPAGEQVMSQQGEVRLYNEAQVVMLITNSPSGGLPQVSLTMQTAYNGNLPGADPSPITKVVPNATESYLNTNQIVQLPFLTLTNTFVDQRQGSANQLVTDVDVGQYASWLATNTLVTGKFTGGSYPTILYVADRRTTGTSTQSVVRLSNGAQLPNNAGLGFTVATQNPLYVQGNYNVTTGGSQSSYGLGSTTNGASVPAALLSDALTLLSTNWVDSDGGISYGSRPVPHGDMTVNAAIVTGNVPSTGVTATTYSGGVENITRFLENWSNVTLTMNTSIVVLFASTKATAQFQQPGNYYNPPKRLWGFDQTYYNPNKQPPGVPCALLPLRFNWYRPPPGSVVSAY
jgi:hypothetical protein